MVTKGICLAKLSLCGYGIIMRRTYILFSFLLMACLLLGGCGLLFGDAAGELRDDGGTKMPAAQGERIPYKLSIEVDGERRATADEKRAAATDPDGESEGVSLGGSPEEGDEAGPAAPQADAPHREGTGAAPSAPKGNSGLSDKMRDLSQLEQLRSDPPDSLLALERRARGDVETAVKLLHSQGYYDGTATFQMDSTTKPVTVRLHLTPGPRYVLGRASVRYEPVPVVPAAHYFCGGILTDTFGRTSMPGLYAIGECACTGLHGANRLASTSLLEAAVWGQSCGQHLARITASGREAIPRALAAAIPDWRHEGNEHHDDPALVAQDWANIRNTMWNYVGISRSKARLRRAFEDMRDLVRHIHDFYKGTRISKPLVDLFHGSQTAYVITQAAMRNKNSIGCHHRVD